MLFDGREFAKKIDKEVRENVKELERVPKIVSILVGHDPASVLYTKLKKQAAERVGVEFQVVELESHTQVSDEIGKYAGTKTGVMVQLPIPGTSRQEQDAILRHIPLAQDIDGLRWEESKIMPATVEAVYAVVEEIGKRLGEDMTNKSYAILGSQGSVGRPLVQMLRDKGTSKIVEIEIGTKEPEKLVSGAEVVISAVGKPGIVTRDMVHKNTIAIDVGISKVEGTILGDMERVVYDTVRYAVPVPGGIGPVTVAMLMKKAVEIHNDRPREKIRSINTSRIA